MILCLTIKDYFDIAESIAIIVASISAIIGIDSWRREAKWKRKYEIAEEVLALFYQSEESIGRIRHPWVNINEGKSRTRNKFEKPEDTEILDRAYVVYERYDKEKDVFIQLRKVKHRFKALFGSDTVEPFEEIEKVLNDIFKATHLLSKIYWPRQGKSMSEEEFDKHLKKMNEYESIFWSLMEEPDPTELRVKGAIEKIEKICKEKIKK